MRQRQQVQNEERDGIVACVVQATEKYGALDIKLPYLRFAKRPV